MKKRAIPIRELFLLDINPAIRILLISDLIWWTGVGLMGPVFALFVVDFVKGGNAAVAGIAAAIFLLSKSIFQVPIATLIDKYRGEMDDFWILVFGLVAASLVPLAYLFISTPLQLYIVEFIYGITVAATFPSFMAIFTRHIDKNKEGTEWGINMTLDDLGAAAAAAIGGIMVETVGFHAVIVAMSFIGLLSAVMTLPIRPYVRKS